VVDGKERGTAHQLFPFFHRLLPREKEANPGYRSLFSLYFAGLTFKLCIQYSNESANDWLLHKFLLALHRKIIYSIITDSYVYENAREMWLAILSFLGTDLLEEKISGAVRY
jgi:hypothetical protein